MRPPALALSILCACAHGGTGRLAPSDDVDDPAARSAEVASALDGYHATYKLTWNGQRIGDARERFAADADALGGWRYERTEHVAVRRGGAVANARTRVVIETDVRLLARRVTVERWVGATKTTGTAQRLRDDGWEVRFGALPARFVDGAAVPSTLVPLLVASGGVTPGRAFAAPVLVEGAGLAVAHLALDIAPDRHRALAQVTTAAGPLRAEATLDDRGYLQSAGSAVGLGSERVTAATVDDAFEPPEIVDSNAIAVVGSADAPSGTLRLRIHDVAGAPVALPDLAMQHVLVEPAGDWDIDVDRSVPPRAKDALAEVRERTHHVAETLGNDMAVAALASDEALAAGRGDCTAHAVVLAADLSARGYSARLVTGYLFQNGALRRHRWVLVQLAAGWIPVDPMLDEVPASPAHVALAVHGTSLDELAFVDDVAFAGWAHARAERVR